MFFRSIYLYFNNFINNNYFFKFMKSFDYFMNDLVNFNKFSFFTKLRLLFFPETSSILYSFKNKNILLLLDFRKKNFILLGSPFFNYNNTAYLVFSDSILFKMFVDFFKNKTEFNSKTSIIFLNENIYQNTYYLYFFLNSNFTFLFSSFFFKTFDNLNLTKLYFIFYKLIDVDCINNCVSENYSIFNLKKFSSWFTFLKNRGFVFFESGLENGKNIYDKSSTELLPDKNILHILIKRRSKYLELYRKICKFFFSLEMIGAIKFLRFVRINIEDFNNLLLNTNLSAKLKEMFPVKFNESSINKFINLRKLDYYLFLFLRKGKIFNKGRYSRNRQTYRTGFYWCLWLNIFVVYGLHFIFYRFIFSFGYLWLLLFIFFASFIFSRALKYNYISATFLANEFINFFKNIKIFIVNLQSTRFFAAAIQGFDFKLIKRIRTFSLIEEKVFLNCLTSNDPFGIKFWSSYYFNLFLKKGKEFWEGK